MRKQDYLILASTIKNHLSRQATKDNIEVKNALVYLGIELSGKISVKKEEFLKECGIIK